jgi:hypothetical protein
MATTMQDNDNLKTAPEFFTNELSFDGENENENENEHTQRDRVGPVSP